MKEVENQTNKDFVKWFSELDKNSKKIAGEKGANLGELYKNNLPVPTGFVITTKSFETFLEKTKLKEKIFPLLNKSNIENPEKLKETSEKIRKLIVSAELPEEIKEEIIESYETLGTNKLEIERGSARDILHNATEPIFVSIRSSLENPIKTKIREQDTYLNIKGNDQLLTHIKKCFASIFREETIKRTIIENSLDSLNIAVIVQKMIQSEKAGTIFSKDSNKNILINAIWGLGEGMNISEVIPDTEIISEKLEILDKKIGDKKYAITRDSSGQLKKVELSPERSQQEVLLKHENQRLADLSQKIESIFGKPQEIEFALEGGNSYILQTKEIKSNEIPEKIEEKVTIETTPNEIPEKIEETIVIGKKEEIQKIEKITKTKIKLILDDPKFSKESRKTGINKIGLVKIEKIIEKTKKHPKYYLENNQLEEYEQIISQGLEEISEQFEEMYVRTSDFKSDEFDHLERAPLREKNPFMGLHGIRFGLKYSKILKAELKAIKKLITEDKKIGILIPQITSIKELKKLKEYLIELNIKEIKIGLIIETPAAVQMIKDFAEEEIDLIVIESDNLIQSLLVLDEKNEKLQEFFEEIHPALLYQLEYLIRVCKRRQIETALSGDLIKNKEILKLVIQKGINSILVYAKNAKEIAEKIYSLEEEIIKGTDEEPRQYEISKEKESLETKNEDYLDLEKNIKAIEEEKMESLNENNEEKIEKENLLKEHVEKIPEEKEILEIKNEDYLDLEKNIEAIEEEKKEYLKENQEKEIEEENFDEIEKEELATDKYIEDKIDNSKRENEDTLGIF